MTVTPPTTDQPALPERDRRARWIGLTLLVASLALIGVSSVAMAFRLADRNEKDRPTPFATVVAAEDEFVFEGVPFAIEHVEGPPDQVEIRWGEDSARLMVGGIDNESLPGLRRYIDWLSVMMVAEGFDSLARVEDQVRSGEIPARLVVVARSAPPGMDPESWGAAKYKDAIYTFLELEPDGTITRSERTYREIAGDVYSWRHVVAMKVTPGLNTPSSRSVSPISYPNYAGVRQAMEAMGWTWPAFGLGALGTLSGLLIFLTSFVHRPSA